MANASMTIFAGRTDPAFVAETLRQMEPEVKFQGDGAEWRQAVITRSKFLRRKTLVINNDPNYYGEPNWSRQKDGMRGFIGRFSGIHRNPKAFELINGMEFALGIMMDPAAEGDDPLFVLVRQLTAAIDGVLFIGGAEFVDPDGRSLISPTRPPDAQARWPKFCVPVHRPTPDPERLRQFLEKIPAEARERKLRSEAFLIQEKIGVNYFLGAITEEPEMRRLGTEEIVRRMLCVLAAAMHGEGVGQKAVKGFIADKGITTSLTPEEGAFIAIADPPQEARMRFGWRYECVWVLLWALGYVEELAPPNRICEVPQMAPIVRERSVAELVRDARLRTPAEILDQADLSLRYHWAEVEARVRGGTLPPEYEPGVIAERHYAFNWLVDPAAGDWDDVQVHT